MSEKRETGCWVRLAGLSGAAAWRWLAEAEPVTLAGWERLALYLHPDITDGEQWSVTEASSGRQVGWGRTREAAIASATRRLTRRGLPQVSAAIAAAREKYGLPLGPEGQE